MISLQDLTVGQVSGMIAAAVFVVQFLIPIALPIILLGLLRPRASPVTESAVSWSVISRFFQSSLWPLLLRTDSAATSATSKRVVFMSFFKTFMLVLIAIAAVVTPLGLYEGIVAEPLSEAPTFHYIKDISAIGFGTPPRDPNNTWSRLCGGGIPCPNDNNKATVFENKTMTTVNYEKDWYDTRVPQKVIDVFQSGTSQFDESVSSAFDIQYRTYTKHVIDDGKSKGPVIDNGTARTIGNYQPLSSLLLNDAIMAIEGLIVDMKNGGIGFRNHSAPKFNEYGSEWTEDLLFIVPETVCVDTNLTLDFSVPRTQSETLKARSGIYKPVIVDRGGFTNLNKTYPRWDIGDVQANPVLGYRAYRAAWLRNAYSMAYMNVTNLANETTGKRAFSYLNSELNKTFPLYFSNNESASSFFVSPQSISIGSSFGQYLSGTEGLSNKSRIGNTTTESKFESLLPIYTNPSGINYTDWGSIDTLCRGQGGMDLANITHITSLCGVLNGAARRKDGKDSVLFDPGSEWSIPMYTCMSTAKAMIKTVKFRFNGTTDDLSSLEVRSLTDKVYPNEESKPLWAVENTSMLLRNGGPLWGLVTPETAKVLNVSTVRKEALYLPGRDSSVTWQNLPAADFAAYALNVAYQTGSSTSKSIDYSGQTNLAMFRKWQQLSQTPASSAKILNLIWTDVAANLVVGTKGLQPDGTKTQKRDESTAGTNKKKRPSVTSYTRRVKYHYAFGIPAFLALALTIAAALATLVLMLFAGATPATMRAHLQHLSAGRLLTAQSQSQAHAMHSLSRGASAHSTTALTDTAYGGFASPPPRSASPGEVYSNAPTRVWAQGAGRQRFTLGAEGWTRSSGAGRAGGMWEGEKGGRVSYVAVPNPY